MSRRLDGSWVVFRSVEGGEHVRCVDLFSRTDGRFGFEEFRRDVVDIGSWSPIHSAIGYPTEEPALVAVRKTATGLAEALGDGRPG